LACIQRFPSGGILHSHGNKQHASKTVPAAENVPSLDKAITLASPDWLEVSRMSPEKIALASNQSPHIHQDVMASRAIVTTPMHHGQVDPDQTHETVSHLGECAEQLRQARFRQLEEMRRDEGLDKGTRGTSGALSSKDIIILIGSRPDEQRVTRLDPTLDFKPSDANRDLLRPRRHKSPDPLGALKASLSYVQTRPVDLCQLIDSSAF